VWHTRKIYVQDGRSSKENSPPKKKTKVQPSRQSQRVQLLKPADSNVQSGNTNATRRESRHQLIKPVNVENEVLNDNDCDDDDDNESEDVSDKLSAIEMYKLPSGLDGIKTGEQLSSEKPHLPTVSSYFLIIFLVIVLYPYTYRTLFHLTFSSLM